MNFCCRARILGDLLEYQKLAGLESQIEQTENAIEMLKAELLFNESQEKGGN